MITFIITLTVILYGAISLIDAAIHAPMIEDEKMEL
jgi:hypothetical protein